MSAFLIIMMFALTASDAYAQTLNEWFNQKKTQKKYLLEQIAALKIYTDYLQKGYSIAKDGLKTISDFKNGEFHLHEGFFDSLRHVNPEVRSYANVSSIIKLQHQIISVKQKTVKDITRPGMLEEQELLYIKMVFERLLSDCERILDELILVTTNGKLQMSDDERIRQIDGLHRLMKDNYTFCKSFSSDALLLSKGRVQAKHDLLTSRINNGLKD